MSAEDRVEEGSEDGFEHCTGCPGSGLDVPAGHRQPPLPRTADPGIGDAPRRSAPSVVPATGYGEPCSPRPGSGHPSPQGSQSWLNSTNSPPPPRRRPSPSAGTRSKARSANWSPPGWSWCWPWSWPTSSARSSSRPSSGGWRRCPAMSVAGEWQHLRPAAARLRRHRPRRHGLLAGRRLAGVGGAASGPSPRASTTATEHLLKLSYRWHMDHPAGEVISSLGNFSWAFVEMVDVASWGLLPVAVIVVSAVVVLAVLRLAGGPGPAGDGGRLRLRPGPAPAAGAGRLPGVRAPPLARRPGWWPTPSPT